MSSKITIEISITVEQDPIVQHGKDLFEYVKYALSTDWTISDAPGEIDIKLLGEHA